MKTPCQILAAALAASLPGAMVAQGTFSPPAGCAGTLTIQNRGCLVTHVWQCEADDPGLQWVALFTEAGPFQVKQVDAEFQWLTTFYLMPARTEVMEVPAPDPESLTELFETGYDTYDFTTVAEGFGGSRRFTGFDRITGRTEIDGEPLRTTEYGYEVRLADGTVVSRREGRQYVSERHRIFILGQSWEVDAEDAATDFRPVEFIYPGEPGFLAARPIYGCGEMMSALPVLPASTEPGQ